MRYFLAITFIAFLIYPLHSQSISELDNRYGMKTFKLESEYSSMEDHLVKIGNKGPSYYYKYTGNDIEDLFGYPIDNITLQYYSNHLYKIIFTFFWGETDNELLADNLADMFGNPTKTFVKEIGPYNEYHFEWNGEKANLSLVYDNTTTRLTMYSMRLHRDILKNEF